MLFHGPPLQGMGDKQIWVKKVVPTTHARMLESSPVIIKINHFGVTWPV